MSKTIIAVSVALSGLGGVGNEAFAQHMNTAYQARTSSNLSESIIFVEGDSSIVADGVVTNVEKQSFETVSPGLPAVEAKNGGVIIAEGVEAVTAGINANAIQASGDTSLVNFNNGLISTSGGASHGVFTSDGGAALILNTRIDTTGNASRGLVASGDGSTISADSIEINTSGSQSYGVYVLQNGQFSLANSKITTSGPSSHGASIVSGGALSIQNSIIQASGNGLTINSGGVMRVEGSTITSNTVSSAISSWGAVDTHNFFEISNSKLDSVGGSAIKVRGDGAHDFLINGSIIDGAVGGLFVISPNPDGSFSSGSSNFSVSSSVLNGDIDVATDPDFVADFTLENSTQWSGAANGINTLVLNGESAWDMTKNSSVKSLVLDTGFISFNKISESFKTLTAESLSGNGNFFMSADLGGLTGDLLVVTDVDGTTGNHVLIIEDSGSSPNNAKDKLMMVDTNGGDGSFKLYGDHIDAGAFRYTLAQEGEDWYLVNSSADPAHPKPQDLSKGANAAVATHTATARMLNSQNDSLVKRLGELRMGNDEGGVWTRAIGKQFDVGEKSSRAYIQNVNGIEIGADKAIKMEHGKAYFGAMVGAANSDLNFGEGASAKVDSKMVGFYATYIEDSGVYVDGVFKLNRLDNEIKTPTNLGNQVKSSYNTNGIGLSIEAGKHIKLDSGWFVEPQLAISASKIQGASYSSSKNMDVNTNSLDSLQSRVGSIFGRSIQLENGMSLKPYAKASYITEHAGKGNVEVDGTKLSADLQVSRFELGVGGIMQVSDNSKISLDAEYTKGSAIKQPWGVTLGYRYTW